MVVTDSALSLFICAAEVTAPGVLFCRTADNYGVSYSSFIVGVECLKEGVCIIDEQPTLLWSLDALHYFFANNKLFWYALF
mgnify:CR=1 FL=1